MESNAECGVRSAAVCPKCKQNLVIVEFEGVELDYCVDCRGSWFDTGELELIIELAGGEKTRLQQMITAARDVHRGERRCPRCRRKMDVLTVGPAPGVEIDRCPRGEGVWLDAGELATLVKAYADREDAALAAFLGDLFHHELTGETEES